MRLVKFHLDMLVLLEEYFEHCEIMYRDTYNHPEGYYVPRVVLL